MKDREQMWSISGKVVFWILVVLFVLNNGYFIFYALAEVVPDKNTIYSFKQSAEFYWVALHFYAVHNSVNPNRKKRVGERIVIITAVIAVLIFVLRTFAQVWPDYIHVYRMSDVMFTNAKCVLSALACSQVVSRFSVKSFLSSKKALVDNLDDKKANISIDFSLKKNEA